MTIRMDNEIRQAEGGFNRAMQYLTDQILTHQVRPGTRLPSERELAELIGVGRSAVREAIKVLQTQGIVTSQVGQAGGTTIGSSQGASFGRMLQLHMALEEISHDELTETRVLLERAATENVADTASDEALEELRNLCEQMREASDTAAFNELDTQFHVAIAQAAQNRLMRDLTIAIRQAVAAHILRAEQALRNWDELQGRLVTEHLGIVDALEARDRDRAASLAEAHVRGAHAVLLTTT